MTKNLKRVLSLMLCVLTLFSMFGALSVSAADVSESVSTANRDTSSGQWVKTNINSSTGHGLSGMGSGTFTHEYKVNGYSGFCLNSTKNGPSGDTWCKYSQFDTSKTKYANMTKVVYLYENNYTEYKKLVQKAVTDAGVSSFKDDDVFTLTHYLLAQLNGENLTNSNIGQTYYPKAINNLWNSVKSYSVTIPDDYICYIAEPIDDAKQTLLIRPNNSVTINKTDSVTGKALAGAKFNITYAPQTGSEYIGTEVSRGTYTTDSKGQIKVNLPPGRYEITETSAPSGYQKSSATATITLSGASGSHSATKSFTNIPYIRLQVQKSNANTTAEYSSLKGAVYGVYSDKACKTLVTKLTTDADGVATSGDIAYSTYYCQEITAPSGFAKDTTVYTFTDSGKTVSSRKLYTASTKDNPYVRLQIIKTSSNSELTDNNDCYTLEGAQYGIYTDSACNTPYVFDGKEAVITIDKNGYGCFGAGVATNTDNNDKNTVAYNRNSGRAIELTNPTLYAQETVAPKGYAKNETVYVFKDSGSAASDGTRIFRAYRLKDGTKRDSDGTQPVDNPVNDPVNIRLQKKDAVTGEATERLANAVFEVQYYAQEIDDNYDVKPGATAPNLNASNHKRTWYIATDELGSSSLRKSYTDLAKSFGYASDEFYTYTDVSGKEMPCLPIGTIVIKEVQAPEGYGICNTVFYRRITEEGAASAVVTNKPIEVPIDEQPSGGYIGINKLGTENEKVPGAVYGLYATEANAEKNKTPVATVTTTAEGKNIFKDTAGNAYMVEVEKTYYIKEISAPPAPSPYEISEAIYPVKVTYDNTSVETALIQDVYENVKLGSLKIHKESTDGVVANMWFAVEDKANGIQYNAVKTDTNGDAYVDNLPVYNTDGSKIQYTVRELGFKVSNTKFSYGGYTFTVNAGKCISYKNALYEGVANGVYSCTDSAVPVYSRYYYGDSKQAVDNQNGYTLQLNENSEFTFTFYNTAPTVELEVYKESFDGKTRGVAFEIKDNADKSYGYITTGYNGQNDNYASTANGRTGTESSRKLLASFAIPNTSAFVPVSYRLEEAGFVMSGSNSYYLPERYKELVVTDSQICNARNNDFTMTYNAVNELDGGRIDIIKTSEDGDVSNLYFKITAYETEIDEVTPDFDVPAYLGWNKDGKEIYSLIIKTDENGKATTEGATLYDANGNLMEGLPVYSLFNTDGTLAYKIEELGVKTYNDDGSWTGEYEVPSRYLTNEPQIVLLNDNKVATVEFYNEMKKGNLQVQKTSEDGIVSNFCFEIYADSDGDGVNDIDFVVETGEDGLSEIKEDLPIYICNTASNTLVTYYAKELGVKTYNDDGSWTGKYKVPYRYNTQSVKTFNLSEVNGETVTVNFENTLKLGTVKLSKKNKDNITLSGAEYKLYRADDDTQVNVTSTGIFYGVSNSSYKYDTANGTDAAMVTKTDGSIYVTGLPQGDYYFIETKAPAGYELLRDKIEFTIAGDSSKTLNAHIDVTDTNKLTLTPTGGDNAGAVYGIAGIVLVCVGLVVLIIINKKKNNKNGGQNNE